MNKKTEPIIINTDNLNVPVRQGDLWNNRSASYQFYDGIDVPKCSIMVLGYHRFIKTKYCVECILKYTQDVDYELILIDNDSDDETFTYFQTVPHQNKKIIRITKNIGIAFALNYVSNIFCGKYLVFVSNDVYVTKNWLSNLLKCYESDKQIGFAMPVSSKTSNLQQVDLNYTNFDEMQKKAALFNKSDSSKWEERIRLISIISIYTRPVLDIIGTFDSAYIHDFSEDDFAMRLRRSGYKLVLCKDTWVCHDHDIRKGEDKDPIKHNQSLKIGRDIFRRKYHDIDAWDDIVNFELVMLSQLKINHHTGGKIISLAIDARCGTPVLEIRNKLRQQGISDIESQAFTTQAKYYLDLQTVCDEVVCDRIDFIQTHYSENTFDVIALCEPLNTYPVPVTLLQNIYGMLRSGGLLLFKLRNTDDYNSFLRMTGYRSVEENDIPAVLHVHDVCECLALFGGQNINVISEREKINETIKSQLLNLLHAANPASDDNTFARLITKNYVFKVTKG